MLTALLTALAASQLASAEPAGAKDGVRAERSNAKAARTVAAVKLFRIANQRALRDLKRRRPPPPPPPPPPPGSRYAGRVGYTSSLVWYQSADQLDWLRRARATGASWVREDFHWGAFEPSPGAAAVHGGNPAVKVLASADVFQMRTDTNESLDWFRLLLQADPGLFRTLVDAYSVHLYSQERGPYDLTAQQRWRYDRSLITRDLAAAAGASHPLWITEFGWTTNPDNPDSVSEATQATYVRQALERATGEWAGFVERTFMYHWGRTESDHAGDFGPFRRDGSAKPLLGTLTALLNGG